MNKRDFFKPLVDAVNQIDDAKRTPLPDWDLETIQSSQMPTATDRDGLWTAFKDRFHLVSGKTADSVDALLPMLQEQSLKEGYLDPALQDKFLPTLKAANIATHDTINTDNIDRYQFGITRAAGVIAETGTIILKEDSTSSRLGALSPWIHIAVLENSTPIYPTLYDAIADFGNDPYIIFVTGPSKTADVEGILIEGVHGPGIQICCQA